MNEETQVIKIPMPMIATAMKNVPNISSCTAEAHFRTEITQSISFIDTYVYCVTVPLGCKTAYTCTQTHSVTFKYILTFYSVDEKHSANFVWDSYRIPQYLEFCYIFHHRFQFNKEISILFLFFA